jgi:hypothetical protein
MVWALGVSKNYVNVLKEALPAFFLKMHRNLKQKAKAPGFCNAMQT